MYIRHDIHCTKTALFPTFCEDALLVILHPPASAMHDGLRLFFVKNGWSDSLQH